MVKLQRMGDEETGYHMITIPSELRKAKGWKKGDHLEWEVNDNGNLVVTEAE